MSLPYETPGESWPDEIAVLHGKGGLSGRCRSRLSGLAISRSILCAPDVSRQDPIAPGFAPGPTGTEGEA